MRIFSYADTIIMFVIPFTIIIILNTFTYWKVWKSSDAKFIMKLRIK